VLFIFSGDSVIIKPMKNCLFFILVVILLTAAGWLFYSGWFNSKTEEGARATIQSMETSTPIPSQEPSKEPIFKPLPSDEQAYQKPAEDAVIKFPVFNYHHIRPMPSEASSTITDRAFTVSPEGFEAHLKYFQENGYQTVLIDDLLSYFDTGKPLPAKAISITFDDGRYGQYKWAYPLLRQYGMVATFFITTDWVGKETFLTWSQIKEMSDNGMAIGSHALDHPSLSVLSGAVLKKELEESKKIIEEKIGKKIDYLAYKGGSFNEKDIEATRAAGYQAALSVYKIIDQMPKYRYVIRRFHADDPLESITSKLTGY